MPSFTNSGLKKYEDKFYVSGIGRISFSIRYHDLMALSRISASEIEGPVRKSATGLTYRIRTNAPYRFGDLQRGIIPSAYAERTAAPDKVVYDIFMDPKMNDTFIKFTKSGKRYYYPASQEYGFRIGRARKQPGLYYMRDTAVEFFPEHEQIVAAGVQTTLEDL